MAKTVIDISTSSTPGTDAQFSEQRPNTITGPTPVLAPNITLENNAVQAPAPKDAAVWTPMTAFDDGLKSALIDFIDTTKEGVKYAKNFNGRTKVLEFFFTGTATKSIKPSEIGTFRLVFTYPPNIINSASVSAQTA